MAAPPQGVCPYVSAASVMSPLSTGCSQHRTIRISGKPLLDKPDQGIAKVGQQPVGTGKREELIPHRVVVDVPFNGEALLPLLHMRRQRPKRKSVTLDGTRFFDDVDDPAC